jgi:hypothetical protein
LVRNDDAMVGKMRLQDLLKEVERMWSTALCQAGL